MRLFEKRRSDWPTCAGKATLKYSDKVEEPYRDKKTIVIPERGEVELFRLKQDWSQFLLSSSGHEVWFGGTDENPFLVQLNAGVYSSFLQTQDLYSLLVPELMESLCKIFPKLSYSRQGDIFVFPLPYSWEDIEQAANICWWRTLDFSNKEKRGEFSLFETRHTLKGLLVSLETSLFGGRVRNIVEGTIVAPDHSPKVLEGPHAVAQTRNLYNPKEAD